MTFRRMIFGYGGYVWCAVKQRKWFRRSGIPRKVVYSHVDNHNGDMTSIDLTGSENLRGIEPGGYGSINYSITNKSTKPVYVFIRVTDATAVFDVE